MEKLKNKNRVYLFNWKLEGEKMGNRTSFNKLLNDNIVADFSLNPIGLLLKTKKPIQELVVNWLEQHLDKINDKLVDTTENAVLMRLVRELNFELFIFSNCSQKINTLEQLENLFLEMKKVIPIALRVKFSVTEGKNPAFLWAVDLNDFEQFEQESEKLRKLLILLDKTKLPLYVQLLPLPSQ